ARVADWNRARGADRAGNRVLRLLASGGAADRVPGGFGDRRNRRGGLPGATRREAERPAGAPVRVTRAGRVALLAAHDSADAEEAADLERMRGWARTLDHSFSREQPDAHFTASAIVVDEPGDRTLGLATRLGRLGPRAREGARHRRVESRGGLRAHP